MHTYIGTSEISVTNYLSVLSSMCTVWTHVRGEQMEAVDGGNDQQRRPVHRHTDIGNPRRQVCELIIKN